MIHYFELPNDCKQYNDLMQNDLTHVTKNLQTPKKYFCWWKQQKSMKSEKDDTLVVVWRGTPFALFHLYLFLPRASLL